MLPARDPTKETGGAHVPTSAIVHLARFSASLTQFLSCLPWRDPVVRQ
jgi:hypothetical protein